MGKTVARQGRVGQDLTEGPIMRTLITFAIPIVLASLVQQLYSLVDVIVVGKFVGNIGTVGVNTGGEIADMVMPVAMGISSAGQIYISQLTGAREEEKVQQTIGTLLSFMLMASVAAAIGTIVLSDVLLDWLNCPEEALGQAKDYMVITALGFPFIFGYNAVVAVLRGMGESKQSLYFILIAAAVNVVLDILLVAVIPLEAAGTAIATAVSQLGSFAAAAVFLWKKRELFGLELKLSCFKPRSDVLWVLIRLGIPQVLRSVLVRFGMLWVNAEANSFGLVVSATNSVGNKLNKFLEVFIQGVDAAATAMIGQNLGARKTARAGKITLCTFGVATFCATMVAIPMLLIPEAMFSLFTSDPAVIELGAVYLRILVVLVYSSAFTGSFQAMVTGSGFMTLAFAIGMMDGLVCRVGFSWLFANVLGLGYIGLFWGASTARIIPGLLCLGYFLSGKWKTRKLLTEK